MRLPSIITVAIGLILLPAAVFALPQVAVLDTVVPEEMDHSVAIPITDKISEELVNSGKYTVLDRASVEQVLREKEFQLSSGLVKNEEIRKAGEYLGAAFVVVARASKVGGTYFLSARMIDVKSGAITAQTSVEKPGNIDVLLALARTAGNRLAGGVVEKVAEERITGPVTGKAAPPAPRTGPEPVAGAPVTVVGVKLGGNMSSEVGNWTMADTQAGFGMQAGVYVSRMLGRRVAGEVDLLFVQKGFSQDLYNSLIFENFTDRYVFNYLELPILFRFFLLGRNRISLGGGAYAAYLLGGKVTETYEYSSVYDASVSLDSVFDTNPLDYGLVLSAGYDLPFHRYLLNVELRYALSLSTWANQDSYPNDQPLHSVLTLLAGAAMGLR